MKFVLCFTNPANFVILALLLLYFWNSLIIWKNTCNLLPKHEWFKSFSIEGYFNIKVNKYILVNKYTWEFY